MRRLTAPRGALAAILSCSMLLAGCGGGGSGTVVAPGGGSGVAPTPAPTPTPSPVPAAATCSLPDRKSWALGQLREWYLFPETLATQLDPAPYPSVDDYIFALTAGARAQRRDRFFTYVTSIAEENAFNNSGQTAGFGFRLAFQPGNRVVLAEVFDATSAERAGLDRGTEILAVGPTAAALRPVADIVAQGSSAALVEALGPDDPSTTRVFRIADAAGTREVTLAKTGYALRPVSLRYGAKIIDYRGQRFGYLNLRTFIFSAEAQMRAAFAQFRQAGVTDVAVDLRYNGGGLIQVADLLGDLLGGSRSNSEIFNTLRFRPEKASSNVVRYFQPQPESIAPMRMAFITTSASASASELVINAFVPYYQERLALVGANTFGKPVGQIGIDRPECDDRLRVVAFAGVNSANQGDYYDGLATTVRTSCAAADDVRFPMGDLREASTRQAFDFLAGDSCAPIGASAPSASAARRVGVQATGGRPELVQPAAPSPAQRNVPGSF